MLSEEDLAACAEKGELSDKVRGVALEALRDYAVRFRANFRVHDDQVENLVQRALGVLDEEYASRHSDELPSTCAGLRDLAGRTLIECISAPDVNTPDLQSIAKDALKTDVVLLWAYFQCNECLREMERRTWAAKTSLKRRLEECTAKLIDSLRQ